MHVIAKRALRDFWSKHPDAEAPLQRWYALLSKSHARSFADLKKTFGSADWVNGLVVFDIAGNRYRVIADLEFERSLAFIKAVLTHAEYDRKRWMQ